MIERRVYSRRVHAFRFQRVHLSPWKGGGGWTAMTDWVGPRPVGANDRVISCAGVRARAC